MTCMILLMKKEDKEKSQFFIMYLKKTVIYHNCSGQAIRIMEMKLLFGVWPNEKDPIILRAFLQSFEIRIQSTNGGNVTNEPYL